MSHPIATTDGPPGPVAEATPPEAGSPPAGTPSPAAPAVHLTDRATSGFAFFAAQTVAFKAASLVGQAALMWILTETDLGLFTLCVTVATFIECLPQGGLKEVLTRRKRAYRVWAPAVFWMSLAMGFVAAGLMCGAGPLMARFYGSPELVGLMAVLALACPFYGLSTLPMARLQMDLRFRTLAMIAAVVNIGILICTICLALLGFEAYSFVISRVVMAAVQAAVLWRAAGTTIVWKPHLRRWPYLAVNSALLLLTFYLYSAAAQGDRIILGRWTGDAGTVGLYAFAMFISLQTIQTITTNLEQIFFPTLCEIRNDAPRQTAAFLRASRVLAVAAAPACFFQAALADPLIRLVFESKWYPAIPATQILSLGMAVQAITFPTLSLMRAQGRFTTLMRLAAISAGVFFVMLLCGVWLAGAGNELLGVAVSVSIYLVLIGVANTLVAIRPTTRGAAAARAVLSVLGLPIASAAVAIGGAWAVSLLVPEIPGRSLAQVALVTGIGGPLYLALIRAIMPDAWTDVRERIGSLLARIRQRIAPAAAEAEASP